MYIKLWLELLVAMESKPAAFVSTQCSNTEQRQEAAASFDSTDEQ